MKLTDRQLKDAFNEYLDEVCGDVTIGQYTYTASYTLNRVDPIAYNEDFNNWLNNECEDERLFIVDDEYYSENPENESEV
jgi:hypothetical protein